MAIDFSTNPGGAFPRIGRILSFIKALNIFAETSMPTLQTAVLAQYISEPEIAAAFAASLTADKNAVGQTSASVLQQLAINTINEMVKDDNPQSSSTDIGISLAEFIDQMIAGGVTVQRYAVSASAVADGDNEGNGVVVLSTVRGDGLSQENLFAEVSKLICTADGQQGATSGAEIFEWRGDFSAFNVLNWDFPIGSGGLATVQVVDGESDTNSMIVNGGFEDFTTADTPDQWTIETGTAGVHIAEADSVGTFYTGTSAVEFIGNGATNTAISQEFGTDNGFTLDAMTSYAVNFWCKMSAAPAAGVLSVELIDDGGSVTMDDQGVQNVFTVDLTTLGTTFVPKNGIFRTPKVNPESYKLRFRLSTPLSSSRSLYIDRAGFVSQTRFYEGGPFIAMFSADTPFIIGDIFNVTTTNGRPADNAAFQLGFDRLFGMRQLGLLLPSANSPTISEALIP